MPVPSLNHASEQLHQAIKQFTAAHDAATSSEKITDRMMLEVALTNLGMARSYWRTQRGLTCLIAAERHLMAVLGMEDAS